jgi:hypothetical protein
MSYCSAVQTGSAWIMQIITCEKETVAYLQCHLYICKTRYHYTVSLSNNMYYGCALIPYCEVIWEVERTALVTWTLDGGKFAV